MILVVIYIVSETIDHSYSLRPTQADTYYTQLLHDRPESLIIHTKRQLYCLNIPTN